MATNDAAVCDASVLASIAFGDPHAADALRLLSRKRLYAPSLLRYELAHVAVRRRTTEPEENDRVAQAFAAALRVPMTIVEPAWPQVLYLARECGLSAYDASYLQIALALHIPLATLDRRLAAAAERLGVGTEPSDTA